MGNYTGREEEGVAEGERTRMNGRHDVKKKLVTTGGRKRPTGTLAEVRGLHWAKKKKKGEVVTGTN